MKAIIAALAVSVLCLLVAGQVASYSRSGEYHIIKQTKELDAYVDWWHKNYKGRAERAKAQYVPIVVREATIQQIDPLLPGIVISHESSWIAETIGKRGEKGLMQIMPDGFCDKGQEIDTPEGSIEAGVACLRIWLDRCEGDILGALSGYQRKTGWCTPYIPAAKRRYQAYIDAINLVDQGDVFNQIQQSTDAEMMCIDPS